MKEPLSVRIYKFTKEARPGWSVERLEDETYFPDWISEIRELEAEIERLKRAYEGCCKTRESAEKSRDQLREALEAVIKVLKPTGVDTRISEVREARVIAIAISQAALAGAGETEKEVVR